MSAASQIRITKIRISKDKVGEKYAAIEITRILDESDRYSDSVTLAVHQMRDNPALESLKLAGHVNSNLTFWAAAGLDRPSSIIVGAEIGNFKLRREETEGSRSYLIFSFEFEIKLEDARQWIIPSFGDDVLCVVEEGQLSFPKDA